MFGNSNGVGELNVYISSSNGTTGRIFHKAGNQGDSWKREAIEIPPNKGLQVCVYRVYSLSLSFSLSLSLHCLLSLSRSLSLMDEQDKHYLSCRFTLRVFVGPVTEAT